MRPPASTSAGLMICAAASWPSMCRMRPSMNACLSLAASYSAFSDRSPCARASEMAWMTAWRSTVLSRCSSSFSFSAPRRVRGIVAMSGYSKEKSKPPPRNNLSTAGGRRVQSDWKNRQFRSVSGQFRVQFLQGNHRDVVLVLERLGGGLAAGHRGVVRDAVGDRGGADVARVGNRRARLVHRREHQLDLAALDHVGDVRAAVLDLVAQLDRDAGLGDGRRRALGGRDGEAEVDQV